MRRGASIAAARRLCGMRCVAIGDAPSPPRLTPTLPQPTSALNNVPTQDLLALISSSSATNRSRSLRRHLRPLCAPSLSNCASDANLIAEVTVHCSMLLGILKDIPSQPGTSPIGVRSLYRPTLIPQHLLFGTKHRSRRDLGCASPPIDNSVRGRDEQRPFQRAALVEPRQRNQLLVDMCRLAVPMALPAPNSASDGTRRMCALLGPLWDDALGGLTAGGCSWEGRRQQLIPLVSALNAEWLSSKCGGCEAGADGDLPASTPTSSIPWPLARHVMHITNELLALVNHHISLMAEPTNRRRNMAGRASRTPLLNVRDVIDVLVFMVRCHAAVSSSSAGHPASSMALNAVEEVDLDFLRSVARDGASACVTVLSAVCSGLARTYSEVDGLDGEDLCCVVSALKLLAESSNCHHGGGTSGRGCAEEGNLPTRYARALHELVVGRHIERTGSKQWPQDIIRTLLDSVLVPALEAGWCDGGRDGEGALLNARQRLFVLSVLAEAAPSHMLSRELVKRTYEHAVAHLSSSLLTRGPLSLAPLILGVEGCSTGRDGYIGSLLALVASARVIGRHGGDSGDALSRYLLDCFPPPTVSHFPPLSSEIAAKALCALAEEVRHYEEGSPSQPSPATTTTTGTATPRHLDAWVEAVVFQPLMAASVADLERWWRDIKIICEERTSAPLASGVLLPLLLVGCRCKRSASPDPSPHGYRPLLLALAICRRLVLPEVSATLKDRSKVLTVPSVRAALVACLRVGEVALKALPPTIQPQVRSSPTSVHATEEVEEAFVVLCLSLRSVADAIIASSSERSPGEVRSAISRGTLLRGHQRMQLRRLVVVYESSMSRYATRDAAGRDVTTPPDSLLHFDPHRQLEKHQTEMVPNKAIPDGTEEALLACGNVAACRTPTVLLEPQVMRALAGLYSIRNQQQASPALH